MASFALLSASPILPVNLQGRRHQFTSSFPSNHSIRMAAVAKAGGGGGLDARSCLFNPDQQQPILKEALKEPIAFLGGMFAGILRLDLNEDPLKEWVVRTVEASGITEEEIVTNEVQEEMPEQIEIE